MSSKGDFVTPYQYRCLLDRAYKAADDELLNSVCAVLAENEAAKSILFQKGYASANTPIDQMAVRVPTNIMALLDIWSAR